jgi:hypothetical protein
MPVEAANHLCSILVDEPSRDRVGVDDGFRRLVVDDASSFVFSSTEVRIYNSGHRVPVPMRGKKKFQFLSNNPS